ncbi:MAG: hypothetical protein QXT43_01870 [Candidatus Micrarchaeaceae archaeon]
MDYEKLVNQSSERLNKTTCAYCGAETFARSEQSACNFCELIPSGNTADSVLLPDSETALKMQEIQALIKSSNIDGAAEKIEQLSKTSTNPYVLYVAGRLYSRMSDIAYHSVDYNLKGLMEANAEMREKGLLLESKAREYFYKAIFSIESMSEAKGSAIKYVKFMCLVRLGRYAEAGKELGEMPNGAVSAYAKMVHETLTNSKYALKSIYACMPNELNAVYYLARHLASNGKSKEAEALLESAKQIAELYMAFDLAEKIKQLKDESE